MNTLESVRIRIDPISDEDRQSIRRELANLMNNLHFASSKRYPALLHYVVEKTLEGRSDELKERILGIEVFHRPSDYDTNNDTVVRVAAGEVRKRLALTYHESGDDHAIQILLPAGSYVPEFYRQAMVREPDHLIDGRLTAGLDPENPEEPSSAEQWSTLRHGRDANHTEITSETAHSAFRWWQLAAGVALFVVGAVSMFLFLRMRGSSVETSVDQFWRPASVPGAPVLLCAGSLVPTTTDSSGFTEAGKYDDYPYVSMQTAGTLTSLVDILNRSHTEYLLAPGSATTLADMRQRPTVLLGAYNNKWTLLMVNQLRYRFTAKPTMEIVDTRNPSRVWRRNDALPYKDKDDYAIIARFQNSLTDSTTFVIAGVGKNGTEAAAQFVTSARYVDLIRHYQRDWARKNIEIVLKTTVVDSKTSAPSIEAIEIW